MFEPSAFKALGMNPDVASCLRWSPTSPLVPWYIHPQEACKWSPTASKVRPVLSKRKDSVDWTNCAPLRRSVTSAIKDCERIAVWVMVSCAAVGDKGFKGFKGTSMLLAVLPVLPVLPMLPVLPVLPGSTRSTPSTRSTRSTRPSVPSPVMTAMSFVTLVSSSPTASTGSVCSVWCFSGHRFHTTSTTDA